MDQLIQAFAMFTKINLYGMVGVLALSGTMESNGLALALQWFVLAAAVAWGISELVAIMRGDGDIC